MTELQKMLRGELYNPMDEELLEARNHVRVKLNAYNQLPPDMELRCVKIKEIIPHSGEKLWIEPPFFCDYGTNIHTGDSVYFNFDCVLLDVCPISIGSFTMFGPKVQLLTATHPLNAEQRASGVEFGKPITIGEHCWFGGGAIVCPGVTIGDRVVVGAGAVVTKNIESNVLVAGNPARVIKQIE